MNIILDLKLRHYNTYNFFDPTKQRLSSHDLTYETAKKNKVKNEELNTSKINQSKKENI